MFRKVGDFFYESLQQCWISGLFFLLASFFTNYIFGESWDTGDFIRFAVVPIVFFIIVSALVKDIPNHPFGITIFLAMWIVTWQIIFAVPVYKNEQVIQIVNWLNDNLQVFDLAGFWQVNAAPVLLSCIWPIVEAFRRSHVPSR